MQLTAKNFQSWDEFSIKIDGFTVVTGDTDLGKSAMFRALFGVIRNEVSAGHVKIGADSLEVRLDIDGTHIILTRKAKGSVSYDVNGSKFTSLNGGVPESVAALNLGTINIGDVELDPIFADQFGRQFMVQETPATINAILGAFSATERLEFGKRAGNTRIKEVNTAAKLLADQIQASEERKERLGGLANNAEALITLIDTYDRAAKTAESTAMTLSLFKTYLLRTELIQRALDESKAPDPDSLLPDLAKINGLRHALEARRRVERIREYSRRLMPFSDGGTTRFQSIVAAAGIARISKLSCGVITKFAGISEKVVGDWSVTVGFYRQEKALADAADAKRQIEQFSAKEAAKSLEERNKRLTEIQALVVEIRQAIAIIDTVINAREKIFELREDFTRLESQSAAINQAVEGLTLEAAKASGKVCKECGSVLKGGHTHGTRH